MNFNIDMSKILEISSRIALAVCLACGIIIFFPADYLPFDITEFRTKNGIWIFCVFSLAIAIILSHIIKLIMDFIKDKINDKNIWKANRYVLKNLSDEEKLYLKEFYTRRQTAIMLNLTSPVVKKLETFQVISMSAGTSIAPRGSAPGFIQPWVFELLDKNPDYLKIINTSGEDNANT